MRPGSHKPDSITCLFVFVVIGLLLTTIAKAEDYHNTPGSLYISSGYLLAQQQAMPGKAKNAWLLPAGVSTALDGNMAHIRFDGLSNGRGSNWLPDNTRFVFSMGFEENEHKQRLEQQSSTASVDWNDRYQPMLFLTIGHSW